MKRISLPVLGFFLFAAFVLNGPASFAGQPDSGPEAVSKKDQPKSLAQRFLSFYRDHISAVDGDRCPSHPSCSSYSAEAFKKHGFVMGWLMTVDRLIHEGSEETVVSPRIRAGETWKIYDPVENNDFWWYHPERGDNEKD
jgi:uncharacterized protein